MEGEEERGRKKERKKEEERRRGRTWNIHIYSRLTKKERKKRL